MKNIDWSKAPEGATHYNPMCGDWYKVSGDSADCWSKFHGGWFPAQIWKSRKDYCVARPQPSPSWSGQGLPPVGMVCEMHHESWNANNWPKVTVKYSSTEYFITEDGAGEQHWHAHSVTFRPIRTPEQIAKDEREAAIDDMIELLGKNREVKKTRDHAGILYDAGYRKP